jgi:CelD/BcsL family acetyltransferase involved in cellulose biosynthesis
LLRLHYMLVDGKIAVVSFGYHYRGRAYDQVSGVDDSIIDIPLGHVMTQYCLEQAIANGNDEYSFMLGTEPYKYSFGAQDRTQYAYDLVVNPRVRVQRKTVKFLRGIKTRWQPAPASEKMAAAADENEV